MEGVDTERSKIARKAKADVAGRVLSLEVGNTDELTRSTGTTAHCSRVGCSHVAPHCPDGAAQGQGTQPRGA